MAWLPDTATTIEMIMGQNSKKYDKAAGSPIPIYKDNPQPSVECIT